VAHRALAIGVMVALRLVTGDAQRAVGHETGDGRFAVTRVAGDVGLDGRLVRGERTGARVTRGALPGRGVVVLVTGAAGSSRGVGLEGHGGGMAGHAANSAV